MLNGPGTRKKKISIIGSAHPLRGGGIATFNERLARAYQQNGDQVTVHTFSLQYPSVLFPGKTQYSSEPPPADLNILVQVNSVNPLNWFVTGHKIKRMKPDLVIIRYWLPFMAPCLGTIARIIRRNRHSRVVAITDNVVPHEHRPGDRILSGYFVNSVDGFVTMSRSVLDDLSTFDNTKPRSYCPHPLYDNYGQAVERSNALNTLGLSPDYKYLLFFGFIRDYKGLDILLQALLDPRLQDLPVRLIIAGEFYTNAGPYLDFISRHQLSERVILCNDFIPDPMVATYFSAANLVVQPYKTATQSGVTQVSYHFNVPMVTTRVGGLSEMVPDGRVGYVVEPDPGEIAAAVSQYFTLDKEDEFRSNIREEKTKFSWENLIRHIDMVSSPSGSADSFKAYDIP